ncbi:MAG: 6-phosphogluconolactonase, partial [Clostridia bacterium]|nr:6-phosphogluconolactonase [Clostridia bacterium]
NTPFDSTTHVVKLTESTIKDNSRLFNDISEVPTRALTMGIKSIMESKNIIIMASGKNKADAVYKLLFGPVTEEVPASILQNHPSVTLIVDEEAGDKIKGKC